MNPSNRSGAMLVMVAFVLIIFLVIAAFCVDIAYMHMVRAEMRTAVDAASGFTATADQNVTILGDIFVTDGMSTGDLSVSAGDDITIGGQFYGNFVTFDATDGSVLLEPVSYTHLTLPTIYSV